MQLNQKKNGRTKSMKVTKLYDPLMHQRLTSSVTIVAQQTMSRVGGELYESLVKEPADVQLQRLGYSLLP